MERGKEARGAREKGVSRPPSCHASKGVELMYFEIAIGK